jgi:hypothetical protein
MEEENKQPVDGAEAPASETPTEAAPEAATPAEEGTQPVPEGEPAPETPAE